MSHTQTFDLSYTALCHLILKFFDFQNFSKKKKKKKKKKGGCVVIE